MQRLTRWRVHGSCQRCHSGLLKWGVYVLPWHVSRLATALQDRAGLCQPRFTGEVTETDCHAPKATQCGRRWARNSRPGLTLHPESPPPGRRFPRLVHVMWVVSTHPGLLDCPLSLADGHEGFRAAWPPALGHTAHEAAAGLFAPRSSQPMSTCVPGDSCRSYKARLTGRSVSGPGGTWCHGRSPGQWAPVPAGGGFSSPSLLQRTGRARDIVKTSVGTVSGAHSGRLIDVW